MTMCKLTYKPIENVCFQPWVGRNYKIRTPRLLVVGMSHYDWDGRNVPKYFVTNEVVQGRMSGKYTSQFFTNIVATCKGRLPNDEDKEQFWQSVASTITFKNLSGLRLERSTLTCSGKKPNMRLRQCSEDSDPTLCS